LGKTEAQRQFEDILQHTVDIVQPTLPAEEHSEEALSELREVSIAKEVALHHGIEHRFCDPTREQRRALHYKDGQSLELEMWMTEEADLPNDRVKDNARAIEIGRYFPVREQIWLGRLAGCSDRSVVFICGDAHIESFGRLLHDSDIPYAVIERGIGLTDEDAWFGRARQYLKEHPEILNE
jgi:hypothetical protein